MNTTAISSYDPSPRSHVLLRLWRRLLGSNGTETAAAEPVAAISARAWKQLRQLLQAAAAQGDSETQARDRIKQLLGFYSGANDDDRQRFFGMLEEDYRNDEAQVRQHIQQYLDAADAPSRSRAQASLSLSLESPRLRILRQFNLVPHGIEALVRLRADAIRIAQKHRLAQPWPELEQDLFRLFSLWFDAGFLELSRIGWGSPASLLEKLIRYEAVHEIKSWNDLRNRLDSDRRCYAFFHGRMPEEPLIFVEVALVQQIAGNVQALLDEAEPTHDPASATTAIFYSISNAQPGLRGVSMGEFLIKRVVEQLTHEFPRLQTFATLSPVPGFNRWLEQQWQDEAFRAQVPAQVLALLAQDRQQAALAALQPLLQPGASIGKSGLQALRNWLQSECAWYLLHAKRERHPLDAVARFHFSNGASLHRINWLADTSDNGFRQSSALMVNYLYKLDAIDENYHAYAQNGQLAAWAEVRKLLQAAEQRRKKAATAGDAPDRP